MKEIPTELIDTGNRKMEEGQEIPVQNTYAHARQSFRAQPFSAQPFSGLQKGSQLTAGKGGALSYGVGDRVRHVKFGEGTVTGIKEGGRDYEVTVDFDEAGTRKMFAMFAKLVKV